MSALLDVKNLSIDFKTSNGTVKAVENINFKIKEKEIFALVGESGSGKSTIAFSLMRLLAKNGIITNGSINFNGQDVLKMTEKEMFDFRGKEIAMIFQNPLDSLNPVMTVGKQVLESLLLDNIPKEQALEEVIKIFEDVRIPDAKERIKSYPFELSGGMRQRAMISMMISRKPLLLVADEPTTALDVTIQAQILKIIKRLKNEHNTSVLLITHDFGVVAETADRVGVMYAGNLVEMGSLSDIFKETLHPYTKLLMKALPTISKKEGRLVTIQGMVPNLIDPPAGCRFANRCPSAMEICTKVTPTLKNYSDEHYCACHLLEV
ncbi:ABC transporter ATP-binding protein [Clostridium sp.]|uniref:ABC transporter ATP-binding protein n=1 Tax=Clostridium sp. TaxID=1506 RepID=UPI001A46CA59|nr:ABC transporter ATP-binding protein [Clostridium sp.]MBK5242591.1 ABC transporter ATP-binding protein [Clostridium sp.]